MSSELGPEWTQLIEFDDPRTNLQFLEELKDAGVFPARMGLWLYVPTEQYQQAERILERIFREGLGN